MCLYFNQLLKYKPKEPSLWFVAAIDSLDGVYAYDHCMRVSKVAESLDEKTLQSYLSQSNKQELYKLWNCLDCTISFQDEYDLSTKEIKK